MTYTKLIGAPVLIGSTRNTVLAMRSSGGGIIYRSLSLLIGVSLSKGLESVLLSCIGLII
jgi:hypothetical protein